MADADIAVVGAGAAGLMAAIWAARTRPEARVIVLDGAERLGAKILVAGGGRCNVTHERVEPDDFNGGSKHAIRKVLLRFDVPETVRFFGDLGVTLKREPTGKLFPTTDRARTVLEALLAAARDAGATLLHPRRVESVDFDGGAFDLQGDWGTLTALRLILATGGRSVPKSGSDGHGYALARSLGHTLTPRVLPALVPLLLPSGHPLTGLSGVSSEVSLTLADRGGRARVTVDGSMLCTHFGVSGPAVLDISRHWQHATLDDSSAVLTVNWLPGESFESVDRALAAQPGSALRWIGGRLVERLTRTLCAAADVNASAPLSTLTREKRRALSAVLTRYPLPITGTRGFNYAEVTAGGVPLTEVDLKTLESRCRPGLHLCGEILDVDGRIGGFNFQWAWSSGYVAGRAAAESLV
ncbi:MAG: aminoacetone oxidase family FAD-binding enzyme [Chloroflexi bacterium]|nr:aminoacetone oxidase family FAD-binding enzyme [Chloroflexota bacterium]